MTRSDKIYIILQGLSDALAVAYLVSLGKYNDVLNDLVANSEVFPAYDIVSRKETWIYALLSLAFAFEFGWSSIHVIRQSYDYSAVVLFIGIITSFILFVLILVAITNPILKAIFICCLMVGALASGK